MIIYDKLAIILKERNMQWKDLCQSGISTNVPTKFSQNRTISTDTLDKVCEYLQVQPSDIMEWISNEEYEKRQSEQKNAEKLALQAQIDALNKRMKELEKQ